MGGVARGNEAAFGLLVRLWQRLLARPAFRVWHIMSRGWDPWTERPLPEGVRVALYEAAGRVKWSVVLLLVLGSHRRC